VSRTLGDFFALECKAKALPVKLSFDTPNNPPSKFYTITKAPVKEEVEEEIGEEEMETPTEEGGRSLTWRL